jgi:hypothetical protein
MPGDGSVLMVGASIDSVWVHELPQQIGVWLVLRILGADYEFQEEHKLAVNLLSPELEESTQLELTFSQSEMNPLKIPGMETALLVPTVLQWEAAEFGLYTFEIFIDDKRERSVPFSVRDAAELEAGGGPSPASD